MTPNWYELAIMVLASYRFTRLVGWDDFPPIAKVRDRLVGRNYGYSQQLCRRPLLEHFLHCAFCVGFWISLLVWACWFVWPTPTLVVLVPFALSALVGLTAKNLDA